ncbi:MAG: head-tail connector protein [Alphaproteobacteria bacterium]|nr:head-tail connector protein [Alphaproteobacteria bacterium]
MKAIEKKQNLSDEQIVKIKTLLDRYGRARSRRESWETHWQDCYDYALPQRGSITRSFVPGGRRQQNLYDGTAMDAVDQLAASLLGNLTPPWAQWFGFKPGTDLSDAEAQAIAPLLEKAARTIQAHFDSSNFAVEMHQCFLDLAVGGTATLCFEETEPGSLSAFKFSSVPLSDVVLEEGDNGFLDTSFKELSLTLDQIKNRYPISELPVSILREGEQQPQTTFDVVEMIVPENGSYHHYAILMDEALPTLLSQGHFDSTPTISFRWTKSPGEVYGRSPVMKALPDIKTANKVVELILKNASIAVTGIWQADDDGVLNPANIELVPGAIIPKAIGSQGLKPLEMPGRFDVSELVLGDLRSRIRHALLTDKLGAVTDRRMTATEVLERSAEMAMLLGATYGRLQSELLTPLIMRAFNILKRRGEIPDLLLDGRVVALEYRSPLARAQAQKGIQNTLMWLESVQALGAEGAESVDRKRTAQFLGEALGVPSDLIKRDIPVLETIEEGAHV